MNDKVFFDTNIIIYSSTEPDKQAIARKLITESNSYISTQVLTELCNTIIKKLRLSYIMAGEAVRECCNNNNKLVINRQETIEDATRQLISYTC